ncbi:MAG: hypothetical protein DMF56_23250 [Acidobacteria bacterium]|nr:MAG: hypothetical protein DMF56_23250 [Acidobacteriota bacterium]
MVSERLRKCVQSGLSIIVGTADSERVPATCRAVAMKTNDDFETVTVYIPAATSHETMANIATTRRLAVACSEVSTHETTQIKGVTRAVRLAPREDEAFVRERIEAFAASLESIGLPRHTTRRLAHWPAFAIDVTIEEIFDQTPGPKAGTALR